MKPQRPIFVTLTGVDSDVHISDLEIISRSFPHQVEFGALIAAEKFGSPRFPDEMVVDSLRRSTLRLSAHLCGALARQVFAGEDIDFDLSGFSRVQINLFGRHAEPAEIENAIQFGRKRGIRTILQCGSHFDNDPRCDWLLDNSFGQGQQLTTIPDLSKTSTFCGISGGLSPQNIGGVLASVEPELGNASYWIDAESSLIANDQFSPALCSEFLNEIFNTTTGECS